MHLLMWPSRGKQPTHRQNKAMMVKARGSFSFPMQNLCNPFQHKNLLTWGKHPQSF